MMTKKDYERLAKAVLDTQARIIQDETVHGLIADAQLRGVRRTAAHLADALKAENDRFDTVRFLKACGF